MGIPQHSVKDTKINSTCKTIAEFALDYRTCCDKINQQKKRLLDKRERNKTRGKMITDNVRDIAQNGSPIKSPSGRREEARHDELSKVLQQTNQDEDGANSWKNYPGARLRQRPRNISPNRKFWLKTLRCLYICVTFSLSCCFKLNQQPVVAQQPTGRNLRMMRF